MRMRRGKFYSADSSLYKTLNSQTEKNFKSFRGQFIHSLIVYISDKLLKKKKSKKELFSFIVDWSNNDILIIEISYL